MRVTKKTGIESGGNRARSAFVIFSYLMLESMGKKAKVVYMAILDPRSQRAGSYKIGAVIVNV